MMAKPPMSSLASAKGPSITLVAPPLTSTRAAETGGDPFTGEQHAGHRHLLQVFADGRLLLGRRRDPVLVLLGLVMHRRAGVVPFLRQSSSLCGAVHCAGQFIVRARASGASAPALV